MIPYLKHADEVLSEYQVTPDHGLTAKQVEENALKYGTNAFTREKPRSFFGRIIDACKEPMLILLIFAGIIATAVNIIRGLTGGHADIIECIGIFFAIALSVIITVVMEGKSAKAFEALNRMKEDIQVKVIRDGKITMLSQSDLVVGDIVCVETGDKLSADGRLISSTSLQVDESSLTGESVPVTKDSTAIMKNEKTPVADRTNMLYSGTFVTGGSGTMVITSVGDHTEFGKIARELSGTDSTSTPLQEKLAKLGKVIATFGLIISLLVFLIQVVFFILHGDATFFKISEAFITSIVLIVATVPEGLPTIVAVSLAINIIKMSKQNALVKKMVASETIGCINVICSDKTGTLTENRMTVTDIWTKSEMLKPNMMKSGVLATNFAVNGTANVEQYENRTEFIGNPTECALLVALAKSNISYHNLREDADVVHSYPFSSETKNMTTVMREGTEYVAYTKGSPEKILSFCHISEEDQRAAEAAIESYQKKACRVIGFAHKTFSDQLNFEKDREVLESNMIFDGFVAITDPLRADVTLAVSRCRSAGIDLKILTGDNIVTASAIANELGVLDDAHIAVEAQDVENLTDEDLRKILPKIRVIARSTPTVKMRVVNTLKALGNVVAVTGDGINDAPALKNADVGVAMGITGTEVSKEASDIILLDDSFSTIVRAVEWGRGIFENFLRFIQFQLTVNVSSVVIVLSTILAGHVSPFSALQLLWINLIMDGPPALTLGLEPMRGNLMKRRPTPRNRPIVTGAMLSRIIINGLFISAFILIQNFANYLGGATPEECSTILFSLFVVFQLFNAFNSRELGDESIFKHIFNNKLMFIVFFATFALQIIITQFGGTIFNTVPLSFVMWIKIFACGFTIIIIGEIVRFIKRTAKRKNKA